jgi:hypothetical protein
MQDLKIKKNKNNIHVAPNIRGLGATSSMTKSKMDQGPKLTKIQYLRGRFVFKLVRGL